MLNQYFGKANAAQQATSGNLKMMEARFVKRRDAQKVADAERTGSLGAALERAIAEALGGHGGQANSDLEQRVQRLEQLLESRQAPAAPPAPPPPRLPAAGPTPAPAPAAAAARQSYDFEIGRPDGTKYFVHAAPGKAPGAYDFRIRRPDGGVYNATARVAK